MLDAFGIDASGLGIDADIDQESLDDGMALAPLFGHAAPGLAQEDPAIRPAFDKTGFGEAPEHSCHRWLCDTEPGRDIHLTRFAGGPDKIVDQLDIILEELAAARLACLPEGGGVLVGLRQYPIPLRPRRHGPSFLVHPYALPIVTTLSGVNATAQLRRTA
jgi:hypothetical protein